MFACMVGSPPQPADQRKTEDKMAGHFLKLEGQYSPELVKLVRWCLELDPLERPQSLFALQKVLQVAAAPEPPPPQGMMDKLGAGLQGLAGRLRGLVGRLGGMGKPKAKAAPDTLV
jgi:serine/threonine protein kinase